MRHLNKSGSLGRMKSLEGCLILEIKNLWMKIGKILMKMVGEFLIIVD